MGKKNDTIWSDFLLTDRWAESKRRWSCSFIPYFFFEYFSVFFVHFVSRYVLGTEFLPSFSFSIVHSFLFVSRNSISIKPCSINRTRSLKKKKKGDATGFLPSFLFYLAWNEFKKKKEFTGGHPCGRMNETGSWVGRFGSFFSFFSFNFFFLFFFRFFFGGRGLVICPQAIHFRSRTGREMSR